MLVTLSFYIFLILLVSYFSKQGMGLLITLTWWGILNVITYFSLSGLFLLSSETQLVYFLFFAFFVISFLLTEKLLQFIQLKKSNLNVSAYLYRFLSNLTLFVLLPIQLIFTLRAIYLISFVMTPSYYRSDVFGLMTGTSSLFFNSILFAKAHAFIMGPLQFVIFFAGFSYFINRKKKGLLALGTILIVLDALMMFGRFGYHYLILSLVFYFFLSGKIRNLHEKRRVILSTLAFITILLFTVVKVTNNRGDSNFTKIFETYVITYHTESFIIFDTELKNPNSILHEYTYGLSTFGGVERYFIPIINQFGFKWLSQTDIVGGYLHQNFLVGYDEYLKPLLFNAYGSIFFTMYRDGGLIAVSIFGILFGLFFSFYSVSLKSKDPIDFAIFYGLLFILIYGVFQPTVLGPMLPALFILYLSKVIFNAYAKLVH
ncbi:O-antigen polymerase [Leptospira paudalimensis]|uniref:Oligosaccharide repeat unit polymerase n=1 Tax=Leptospira paudalimensis TaxID=2950024 RepID=A0ABT3M5T8_9LEPT|nr:O-antigen polymerase [Leptospira paudalimensis]MCW7503756.1 oligosaccharide repeat unit polymerase [Leptospira paudalimensis]